MKTFSGRVVRHSLAYLAVHKWFVELFSKNLRKIQIQKRLSISAKTDLPCSAVSLRHLRYLSSEDIRRVVVKPIENRQFWGPTFLHSEKKEFLSVVCRTDRVL